MAVLRQNSTVGGKLIASEDYVDDKIATGGVDIVQVEGQATDKVLSQKAVTDALADTIKTNTIVQVEGQATDKVMSQKASTDSMANTIKTGDMGIAKLVTTINDASLATNNYKLDENATGVFPTVTFMKKGATLTVIKRADNCSVQTLREHVDHGRIWDRICIAGVWQPWQVNIVSGDLLQETGTSTTAAMSQKAVTDALATYVPSEPDPVNVITAPTVTSPVNKAVGVVTNPIIKLSAFTVTAGTDTHTGTSIRIKNNLGVTVWSQNNTTPLNDIQVPVDVLAHEIRHTVEAKYHGTSSNASEWGVETIFTTKEEEIVPEIGDAGARGFGVGVYPGTPASLSALGLTGMSGHDVKSSPNYGNYQHTNGSVMVFVPKFYYRTGSTSSPQYTKYKANAIDISSVPATGFRIHRAFIDGGSEKYGFFIDKYVQSREGNNAVSKKNGKPISLAVTAGYTVSQGIPNCVGQALDAIPLAKQRGTAYNCSSVFMYSALWILSIAHGQYATSTVNCAWYDATGTKNFPKGCNNNALADVDDTTVTFTSAGDTDAKKPLAGSGSNFAKTTHNGQDNGVADLNGTLYEYGLGLTAPTTPVAGFIWVLKESTPFASLTNGLDGATDAWGSETHLNTLYTKTAVGITKTNKWGNGDSPVFFNSPLDGVLPPNDAALSTTGTNLFGTDYVYFSNPAHMFPLFGGNWSDAATAGLGYRYLSYSRSSANSSYGSRSASYGG